MYGPVIKRIYNIPYKHPNYANSVTVKKNSAVPKTATMATFTKKLFDELRLKKSVQNANGLPSDNLTRTL